MRSNGKRKAEWTDAEYAARLDERAKIVAFLRQVAKECSGRLPGVADLILYEAGGIDQGLHHVQDTDSGSQPFCRRQQNSLWQRWLRLGRRTNETPRAHDGYPAPQ
jgi:hypothetical protein